jgi:hypothetical protein
VKFDKLECIVLAHDVVKHGLRAGDLGTVVEIYLEGALRLFVIIPLLKTQPRRLHLYRWGHS